MKDNPCSVRALRPVTAALVLLTGLAVMAPARAQLAGIAERAAARAAAREAAERAASRQAIRRSAGEIAARRVQRQAADRLLRRWTVSLCKASRPCPLPERYASTFIGGSYNEIRLGRDTRLYRVYSSPQRRLGVPGDRYSYWSRSNARGTRAIVDSAIPVTRNGNLAERRVSIVVPRGTKIYEGTARGLTRGPAGGGNQVILEGVRPEWVVRR